MSMVVRTYARTHKRGWTVMRKGGFHDDRRERVHRLLKMIVEAGPVESSKLVALFHYQWGLTPKKIQEYLVELRSLGAIKLNPKVEATPFAKKLLEKWTLPFARVTYEEEEKAFITLLYKNDNYY